MIGSLNGVIISKTPPWLTIECQGVGFEMEAPMSTFYTLGEEGSRVLLYTELLFREDGFHLFGFSRKEEKNFFKIMLKAGGIGPKLTLAIMSAFDIHEFYGIIAQKQSSLLTQVPGIGKKTAERLVFELQDKLPKDSTLPHAKKECAEALYALGYKPQEVLAILPQIPEGPIEAQIRLGLKLLTKR
jgi:Holliday junction DNA helicase RuvA